MDRVGVDRTLASTAPPNTTHSQKVTGPQQVYRMLLFV